MTICFRLDEPNVWALQVIHHWEQLRMVASTGLLVSTTRRCLHTASHNLASGPHPAFRPINTISTARISQHGRLRPVYRSFPKTSSVSRSPVASLQARQYSSDNKAGSSWEVEPVELKYDLTEPPSTSTSTSTSGQSLVICHGLLYVHTTYAYLH